jgi:transcriptional regulator with AAA-type ATPase domain
MNGDEEPSSPPPSTKNASPENPVAAVSSAASRRFSLSAAGGDPAAPELLRPLLNGQEATVAYRPTPIPKPVTAPPPPSLELIRGQANKKEILLGKEKVRIGRAGSNDLVLQDNKASRAHAEILFQEGHYWIQDLDSTNGVLVDDRRVQTVALKPGNRITLGDTELLFKQEEPEITLPDKLAFLQRSDLFKWLDPQIGLALAQRLTVRYFPRGTVVFAPETCPENMIFLYSGTIRVVEINEEGGERRIDQMDPGDYYGERALLAGEPSPYSLIADTDSILLELEKENLNALFMANPELHKTFYRMIFKQLQSAQGQADVSGRRKDNLKDLITATDVEIVGESKKILEARQKIEQLAREEKGLLLIGPSGTGKKTLARYFHQKSPHPDHPYVEISLADLEENQIGSVLYGLEPDPAATHMKGQLGYLELIESGTLAIVHAEQLDAHQQSKLATYLKYGWFHRVYGQQSVKTRTRVLLLASGTEAEVLEKFIPELKELLQGRIVVLPPKDIPLLADRFLKKHARMNGRKIKGLSREATEKLVSYSWPGNIKELENVIQRAAIVTSEDLIIPGDLIFVRPSEKEIHKINLLRNAGVRRLLTHPLTMKSLIWFNIVMVTLMAGFTLYTGLFKPADDPLQQYENNLGMVITWIVWFPLLPLSAALVGRIWCGVCPIAGIGDLISRIKKFNLPVPRLLKRLDFWLVVFTFLLLDYLEEFLDIAGTPLATGTLLLIIIGLSALFCVLYERKAFCRYVCPLAGLLGTYSTLSLVEVRGNKRICQTQCGQHHCLKGTEKALGCPMFSYPASLSTNAECMMCFNCLKTCDQRGVQLNLRPPLQELWRQAQPLLSLSLFGVLLVGLMAHHQFMEGTFWKVFKKTIEISPGLVYTLLYGVGLLLALVPFLLSSTLSAAASQEKISENMAYYGMAFIPLALSGHLAHIGHEFLDEGLYELLAYLAMAYDYLSVGTPIGSQPPEIPPFIHRSINTLVKFMIVLGGSLASLIALVMIARRLSKRNVLARILPHSLVLLVFFIGYLYIFTAPTGKPKPPPAAPQASFSVGPNLDQDESRSDVKGVPDKMLEAKP